MNAEPTDSGGAATGSIGRRALLAGAAGLLMLPRAVRARRPARYVVSRTAGGAFPTLGAALAQVRADGDPRALVRIDAGVYDEKLTVDVAGVTIVGAGSATILTHAAGAAQSAPGGGTWGTSGSATLTIAAPDVTLRGLTIRNAHPYPADPMQAVALAVGRGAARARIDRCFIESYQDTLLLQAAALVTACRIVGRVDFVFGGAAAWLAGCEIVSRGDAGRPGGFIAAPSTPASQPHGLVFADCRLLREPGVPDGSTWLGRPWRAGGDMRLLGAATFLRCWMDAHVHPAGWTEMGYRGPAGERRMLRPQDARLFEWGSTGPGAAGDVSRRRLSDDAARSLIPHAVLGAWA